MKNPYDILGVTAAASSEEIKQAYRRCAMKYHPDRNPGDVQAEAAFKECQNAYALLSDPSRKKQYDHTSTPFGFGQGSDEFSDMFNRIFGDFIKSAGRPQERSGRGQDLKFELVISLEDALRGGEQSIRYPLEIDCGQCDGTGSSDKILSTCPLCEGRGKRNVQRGVFTMQETCATCRGTGKKPTHKCSACTGHGKVKTEQQVAFTLPEGVEDGNLIKLEGHGGHGTARGDLILVVRVKPHARFQRQGADLHCEVPLRVSQAALGASITIETPLGTVKIVIPPYTRNGSVLVARGGGGIHRSSTRRGDLHCHVKLETPSQLTDRQKELLQQLEDTYQSPQE